MTGTLFDIDGSPDAEDDPWAEQFGVPLDILTADSEPETPVDYLRVGQGTARSREFRAFRKRNGALALAWWVALLMVARRDGAFGVLDIDALELAVEATGDADHADDVPKVLDDMVQAGLVWMRQRDGIVTVRVRKWREWQVKSPRDRQRLARAKRKKAEVPVTPSRDSHATASQSRHGVIVTPHNTTPPNENRSDPPRARAGAREADEPTSFEDRLAAHLVALGLYDEERAKPVAGLVVFEGFQRKARFRHGFSLEALKHGADELAAHLADQPDFEPSNPTAYIVKRAQSYDPNAPADLTPTRKARPDDGTDPTAGGYARNPELARFD